MQNGKSIDLIMEGGGVKGIGLVGALSSLEQAGFSFNRVAGTSSGALVASLLAAGYTVTELEAMVRKVDYRRFADESLLDKFGAAGKTLSLLFERGIYEGDYIFDFLSELLAAKGVRTFGDLRLKSDEESDDIRAKYKLVVLATDVTRGKLIKLPWDYADYGLNPDDQEVAAAVRASAALPFYYEPARIGQSYVVDGGVVSNFPIWLFEPGRHKHEPRRPTLGIKLSAKPEALDKTPRNNTDNTLSYAFAILSTILNAQDQIHLNDPCTLRRTIFVDTNDIVSTDFSITEAQQTMLFRSGKVATEKFLRNWDFSAFLNACSG